MRLTRGGQEASGSFVKSYNGVESKMVSGSVTMMDLSSYNSANFDYLKEINNKIKLKYN